MRYVSKVILAICMLFSMVVQVSAVDVMNDKYAGAWEKGKPESWGQCDAPYSNRIFPIWGESYCSASCGGHAITYMLLKAGLLEEGATPPDIESWISDSGIAQYQGVYPYPTVEYKGTKLEKVEEIDENSPLTDSHKEFIKDHYKEGHFIIINVPYHFIALDYVDKDGNIVVLDSGWKMKYLEGAWKAAFNYSGVTRTRIVAYKIEGKDSTKAPKFWEGEAAEFDGDGEGDEGNNGGGTGEIVSEPPEPIIKYQDEEEKKVDDGNKKGLEKSSSIWDILFN